MFRFVFLIVIIVLLAAGWTGAWFYGASQLESQIKATLEASLTRPEQISCETLDVRGFPFRFDITCTNARLQSGDIRVTVPQILATILVYRPTHALVFATGPATYEDAFSGSSRQLRWQTLRASFRTNGWALARISLEAENLELIDTLVGEKLIARLDRAQVHLLDNPGTYDEEKNLAQLDFLARFEGGEVPEFDVSDARMKLESRIESVPDDLRLLNLKTLAENWFELDSGVELSLFEGSDSQSRFEMNGRISATREARLSGDFGLFSFNIADRLLPFIEPTLLQILFGFRDETGGYSQSFSIRHGVVLAGNLPIMTLPALR